MGKKDKDKKEKPMAFPTTSEPLSRALLSVQDAARTLKSHVQSVKDASAAGPISGNVLVELYLRLVAAKASFDAAAAVPGIAAYARDQFGDEGLDVVAEFTAMSSAITACGTWIATNFPASGGYILKDQLTASGVSVRSFSTAQTAGLRTQLDALLGTIA